MTFSRWLAAILLLAVLSSCSSGKRSAEFTLNGVEAPQGTCPVDPQSFSRATAVADFSDGNGCGVHNGYRVTAVDDIGFTETALVTCDVVDSLHGWINATVQPLAQQVYGQKIVAFKIAASYACRPRNNQRGAKLSEHGQGNAIDIAGFILSDGREVNVARDYYGNGQDQRFLHGVRARACGTFHTVLGPGSDPFHRDHIHLDMQHDRRGGGPYCH